MQLEARFRFAAADVVLKGRLLQTEAASLPEAPGRGQGPRGGNRTSPDSELPAFAKGMVSIMSKMHIKKGDTVMIITGNDKGKTGKVLELSPKEGKVIVEGRNMVTKHVKPRKAGDPSGIVKAEGAIYACKVVPVCGKCHKPTRSGVKIFEDGTKSRICKKCGEVF